MPPGSIQVSDGANIRTIDLSKAGTLADVKASLKAQPALNIPPVLHVEFNNYGLTVSLPNGGALEIREVGGGSTARALGILATNNSTASVAGSDLIRRT